MQATKKKAKMMNSGMTSSNSDDWGTPQHVFDDLNEEFGFEVDVCALAHNAKCEKYFTPEQNGLEQEWCKDVVHWMNPPYGRQIDKWIKKAYESESTVVCLVPARTDTKWWHSYCMKGEVRFLKGRLYFEKKEGKMDRAPFPSAIVIFKSR
jgi:phage N-6-adenine-methyltransferase